MAASDLESLCRHWRGTTLGHITSSFTRGVLIWKARDVPYVITSQVIDPDGRYVVIEGQLDGSSLKVAAVYAPNSGHVSFFDKVTPALLTDPHAPIIWGGRFQQCP